MRFDAATGPTLIVQARLRVDHGAAVNPREAFAAGGRQRIWHRRETATSATCPEIDRSTYWIAMEICVAFEALPFVTSGAKKRNTRRNPRVFRYEMLPFSNVTLLR
uniref:hypothetical protein n=1 Tax=Edaphosphingomonas laterariae TaxID=861865 RepID=UPI001181ADE7|nr:hypothetical protein [Sphingomonas laterariae]